MKTKKEKLCKTEIDARCNVINLGTVLKVSIPLY